MKRAREVKPAGSWDAQDAIDTVRLDADARHRRRVTMTGESGTRFLLDLAEATLLRDGDGLALDDGTIVRVIAEAEPLIEVTAADETARLRLAWHLGNRHTPVQVAGDALRIRPDHVLEEMLCGLGATLTLIGAPFDPESGAYGHAAGAHAHSHEHRHDGDCPDPHDHDHHHDHPHGH